MDRDNLTGNFLGGLRIDERDFLAHGHFERGFEQAAVGIDRDGEGVGLRAAAFERFKADEHIQAKHDALATPVLLRVSRLRHERAAPRDYR